jgi:hypothetical protein
LTRIFNISGATLSLLLLCMLHTPTLPLRLMARAPASNLDARKGSCHEGLSLLCISAVITRLPNVRQPCNISMPTELLWLYLHSPHPPLGPGLYAT